MKIIYSCSAAFSFYKIKQKMRSSSISSSRSRISRHQLKQSVACPITSKPINTQRASFSKNKKQFSLEDQIFCEKDIRFIPLIFLKDKQLVVHEEGLEFLRQCEEKQKLQFVGCIGDKTLKSNLFSYISELSKASFTSLASQLAQYMIVIYNFHVKKKNRNMYFLDFICQSFQNQERVDRLLHMLWQLTNSLLFFISQRQQQTNLIQNIHKSLLRLHLSGLRLCHLIYQDHIVIDQQNLTSFEQFFSSIAISSIQQTKQLNLTGSTIISDRSKPKFHRIMKDLLDNQYIRNEFMPFFLGRLMKTIIQFLQKKDRHDMHQLISILYHQKILQTKSQFEQFTTNIQFSDFKTKEQFLIQLSFQIQKAVASFSSQLLDEELHQLYLNKLLSALDHIEEQITKDYEYSSIEQFSSAQDESEKSHQEPGTRETLVRQIQELVQQQKATPYEEKHLIDRLIILGRNAARLNILGYDQKMKIAQLRIIIDQKWNQLKLAHQSKMKKLQETTQENLLREKFEITQEKLRYCEKRVIALKQEIKLLNNVDQHQSYPLQLKKKQYQQLSKLRQKNDSIVKYVSESTIQSPLINTLKNQLLALENNSAQMCLRKQMITESFQARCESLNIL